MRLWMLLFACVLACGRAHGQGTVYFANRVVTSEGIPLLDAPVYDLGTVRCFGEQYMVQLYAAPVRTPDPSQASTVAVGKPSVFQTGENAGYWVPSILVVPNVPGGEVAQIEVRAWRSIDGESFEAAQAGGSRTGASIMLMTLGNDVATAPTMIGLTAFSILPEPVPASPLIVGMMGLLLLHAWRGRLSR